MDRNIGKKDKIIVLYRAAIKVMRGCLKRIF